MILGITGSIGTGKTTLSKYLIRRGIPVYNIDQDVHRIMNNKIIIQSIYNIYPECIINQTIDRCELGKYIVRNPKILKKVEDVIYPYLWKEKIKFIKENFRKEKYNIAFDIPLLFEKKLSHICDYIIVTSVSYIIQKKRVMCRKNMTNSLFKFLLTQQWSQNKKNINANFALQTGLSSSINIFYIESFLKEKGFI